MLFYSFQLSITERQGFRYNFEAGGQLDTFGFRAPITWTLTSLTLTSSVAAGSSFLKGANYS